MFVNREKELCSLEEKHKSDSFECILVYGRRRVGKTELLKQFIHNKSSIYHLAVEEEKEKQLKRLVKSVYEKFGGIEPKIDTWKDFFQYVSHTIEPETILIIDEFPYILEQSKSIPSYFQKFIDEYLKDQNVMLILCGSSIGMMESLMSYKNPLYGRRTGQIDLAPFDFINARKVLKNKSIKEQIEFYSIFGGIPFYLQKVEPKKSLEYNIKNRICKDTEILFEEPEILLHEEFRKPNRYMSILESIAAGNTRPKIIADYSSIPLQSVSKYLRELEKIRLIEHQFPVTGRDKRARKGLYKISDNFFDFWFRFMFPNISDARENSNHFVENFVTPSLDRFIGKQFEKVCTHFLNKTNDFNMSRIGRWWYKDNEIDIVGLNKHKNEILLGECKWTKKKMRKKVLTHLEETSKKVKWHNKQRKEHYALFSKAGFTKGLKKAAKDRKDVELYDLKRIEKGLEK